MLGRKQNLTNDQWLDAAAKAKENFSEQELSALENRTLEQINRETHGKRTAYAWSAGKDSIVLGHLCRRAGVRQCMMGVCDLEYPAFLHWAMKHKPGHLTVINTGQDLEWLKKHESMIFPMQSQVAGRWFVVVQHTAQRRYYQEAGLNLLLLGRRKADGNYVGNGSNQYADYAGVIRYSPLADWSHEAVLAYIAYHNLELPPLYGWKNGYLCGTHPWPARQWTGCAENGWREVWEIDPDVVGRAAAAGISGAVAFLKHGGNGIDQVDR